MFDSQFLYVEVIFVLLNTSERWLKCHIEKISILALNLSTHILVIYLILAMIGLGFSKTEVKI